MVEYIYNFLILLYIINAFKCVTSAENTGEGTLASKPKQKSEALFSVHRDQRRCDFAYYNASSNPTRLTAPVFRETFGRKPSASWQFMSGDFSGQSCNIRQSER